MTASPIAYLGYFVRELEPAAEHYASLLGLQFHPVLETTVSLVADGRPQTHDVRLVISRGGPPYVELIEMHDTGYYCARGVEGLHHVGVWLADFTAATQRLLADGLEVECEVADQDGTGYLWVSTPESSGGTRVEYVDDVRREPILAWLRAGGH